LISGFHREVDQNCAFLGYYHYTLHNNTEARGSYSSKNTQVHITTNKKDQVISSPYIEKHILFLVSLIEYNWPFQDKN
jgi:hypothetical protein